MILQPDTPRVLCAAIKRKDNDAILCGRRHYDDLIRSVIDGVKEVEMWCRFDNTIQGFIDTAGNFLTREEAYLVAKYHNQIIREVGGNNTGKLYSENLY